MSLNTSAPAGLAAAAQGAGLTLISNEPGTDFSGNPTVRYTMELATDPSKNHTLELGQSFDAGDAKFAGALKTFLEETATRLRNPRPDVFLTVLGLPLSFGKFAWPFHDSTSGADTSIVHGEVRLEEGGESILHAKVSASLTRTFAEIVPALEQPFAESFIYNAVRKTMDQGQLELVKSGNRQPVPVTTRYFSAKQGKFVFNDTNEEQRTEFLASKIFWLSGMLGANMPVWITDPRDAQYLNSTVAELKASAAKLAADGLLELSGDGDWAACTDKLRAEEEKFKGEVQEGLNFIKPSFNESMRAGQTNM